MLERANGIGVSNVFDKTGWRVSGLHSALYLFLSLRILSHTRDNSATNPWWPPADKHTAVKRYDILSLRELRRGSCGYVRVRREKSIFERHHGKSLHLVLCAVYLCYLSAAKIFAMCRRFSEFEFFIFDFESIIQ